MVSTMETMFVWRLAIIDSAVMPAGKSKRIDAR